MWSALIVLCELISFVSALLFPLFVPNRLYNYTPPENEVTFHLYHRSNLKNNDQIFVGDSRSLQKSRYDVDLPTKIIIHGWTHGRETDWMIEMRELLAKEGHCNVMIVDWSGLSRVPYVEARVHSYVVAKQLRLLLQYLMEYADMDVGSVHIIGHSLGAQIAAMASNRLEEWTGYRVGRISALDPAAPLFEWPHMESLDDVIDPSDADFIDVIHTNGKYIGMITPVGHVDFYPNGGENQPGCNWWSCSHLRSVEFYIASLRNPNIFKAYYYKDWDTHLEDKKGVDSVPTYPMGIAANPNMPRGMYFLETDDILLRKFVSFKTMVADGFALAHLKD